MYKMFFDDLLQKETHCPMILFWYSYLSLDQGNMWISRSFCFYLHKQLAQNYFNQVKSLYCELGVYVGAVDRSILTRTRIITIKINFILKHSVHLKEFLHFLHLHLLHLDRLQLHHLNRQATYIIHNIIDVHRWFSFWYCYSLFSLILLKC